MPRRFLGLDGLRGVAALSVLLFHSQNTFHPGPLMCHGYLAVDVFFILSGFVIALNYEPRFRSGQSLGGFLIGRGRRLLPVYWIGLIVCTLAWICCNPSDRNVLFLLGMGAVFIPNLMIGGFAFPLNPVTWSLFAEWCVNAVYACGVFRLRTLWLFTIVTAGWATMTYCVFFNGQSWCTGDHIPMLFQFGLLRAIAGFCAGVVIFRLRDRIIPRLPVIAPEILYCLWLVLAVVPTYGPTPVYDAFVVILCAPVLISLLIRAEARAPKWCAAVGRLSYPLYASHLAIIMLLHHFLHRPNPWLAMLGIAAAIALAWGIAGLNDRIQAHLRHQASPLTAAHPAE